MNMMAQAISRPRDERALLFYLCGIFAASGELDGLSAQECKELHDALDARLNQQSEGGSSK